MRTHTVTIAAQCPCYAKVEVEAKSREAAEQKVIEDLRKNGWESPYWTKCKMFAETTEAYRLRVVTDDDSVLILA